MSLDEVLHGMLHRQWTKAVGTKTYVKQEWNDFAQYLTYMKDVIDVSKKIAAYRGSSRSEEYYQLLKDLDKELALLENLRREHVR